MPGAASKAAPVIAVPSVLATPLPSSDIMALLLALAVLIAAAKLMGELSLRLGQPAVLGELAAGLLLGPSVINLLGRPLLQGESVGVTIHVLGQLGVLWLMFAAGLETEFSDLRNAGRPALLAGTLGALLPIAFGLGIGLAFGYPFVQALSIGIILSATSVSISAQTLLELGVLRSPEGVGLLGAAVIDDILVVAILSVFLALTGVGSSLGGVLAQLGLMLAVLAGVAALSVYVLPRVAEWSSRLRTSQALLAMALASVLLLAWATEALGGVAAITGAFLAGLGLGRSHLRDEIERGLSRLAYAFFVPLFLVDIGLQADARALQAGEAVFAVVLILVAVISKVAGSGLGAWLGGYPRPAALRIGIGMISRGEVGLIVAGVSVANGILAPQVFTVVVLMVLATTLVTPPLLRWAFSRQESEDATAREHGDP